MCREADDPSLAENGLPAISVASDIEKKDPIGDDLKKTDSLRAWFICAVCTIGFCGGSVGFRCSGLLLVSIAEEFGVLKGDAAWPTSIQNLFMFFSGIVVGPLAQKYPLKPIVFVGMTLTGLGFVLGSIVPNLGLMTLCFGAVHGFGSGTLLVACNVLLTQYFDRYRGLAFGIAHASSPVASIIFPPLFDFVRNRYGFRYAMLTIGIILMSTAPLALLVSDAPWAAKESTAAGPKNAIFAWSVFREPMFYVILGVNIVFQWLFDTFLATIVDYGVQKGLTIEDVLVIIACYSVFDIVGRICIPALADWGWIGRDTLLTVSYFFSCIFLLLICVCESLTSFIATVSIFGAFFGLASTYYFSMVARYIGSERLPFTLGMMGTIGGLVFLLMPAAIGFFRDTLSDYRYMYLMNTILLFVTSLPWWGVVYLRMKGRSLERA